jgi:predicted transcriptional regulator YheO
LRPVIDGLAESFGSTCEVVLHDYTDPSASVVAVAGNVTGRQPGDAMSEIGLRVLAAGAAAKNDVNYLVRTADGRALKCSTFPLHDSHGELIGALCVNIDVTALSRARDVLADLAGEASRPPHTVNFSGDVDGLIDSVVDAAEARTALPVSRLARPGRLQVVRSLQEAGVFALRGAPGRVASRLGISRAALYADLSALSDQPVVDEPVTSRQASREVEAS